MTPETQFSAPVCFISIITVFSGMFDSSYETTDIIQRTPTRYKDIWTAVMVIFITSCVINIIRTIYLERSGKITTLDLYFSSVLNTFSLTQLICHFLLHLYSGEGNGTFIKRAQAVENWSSLFFFAWSWAWSRHLRRGWSFLHNWIVCLVAVLSFSLTTIHRASFYFVLITAVVMASISIHETYRIHFFRSRVKFHYISILALYIAYFVGHFLHFILPSNAWIYSAVYMTAFGLVSLLVNQLYISIIVEVNEHKK